MKEKLDRFLLNPRTEFALVGLIVLSVALLVVEVYLHRLPESNTLVGWLPSIEWAGDILTVVFTIELSLRFWVAKSKTRYFRNYWIDILAVMPTFRAFRFLRVLRLLRLVRVGVLINRRLSAVSSTMAAGFGSQLGVFLVIGVIVMAGGLAMHLVEAKNPAFANLADALWWSFLTMVAGEPIGGEPNSLAGHIVTSFVMLGGLTLFAVFTGVVSAVMVQRLRMGMEVRELDLDELRKHIVICGWNRAAHVIVEELQTDLALKDLPIVVVAEESKEPDEDLKKADRSKIYLQTGDYTRIEVLETVGIRHAAQAILLADSTKPRGDQDRDARTVLAALTIEKLNPQIHTTAQLLDLRNNVQLQVAGVENVIVEDQVEGHLIATSVRNKGLVGVMTELLSVQVGNQLYKVTLPDTWEKMSYGEACRRLKDEYDALLVGLERGEGSEHKSIVNPPNAFAFETGDELVLIARAHPNLK